MLSLRCLCLLLLAGGFGAPALAGETLSLPQAVTRALAHNPVIRAGDRTVVAAERQAWMQRLLPDGVPTLWCPLLTHYTDDGALDRPRMRAQLDF